MLISSVFPKMVYKLTHFHLQRITYLVLPTLVNHIFTLAMDVKEYKTYHEQHMMHNTGTSLVECTVLLSTVPFGVFLSSFLSPYVGKTTSCILDFLIIILPVIFNCTILSNVNSIIALSIALLSAILVMVKADVKNLQNILGMEYKGRKSFVSNFRASTYFISAICILAVDFTVFPKRLAKTETFGFGFMDLGVGCFICANGFVEKHSGARGQFFKLLKTLLILCALGLIRVLSVKSIDYHEHVSEYGVHWNFFFTLAVCRLLSYLIILLTNDASPLYLSILTGLLHQGFLLVGFEQWVFSNEPRDTFVSANREGLISCLGYISLYFAAAAVGKSMMKNSSYRKLIIKLVVTCLISGAGVAISLHTIGVSRRLCNVGYIFWILWACSSSMILLLIGEISLLNFKKGKNIKSFSMEPTLLQSINVYGLFYFLLSNLLTGLVNSVFQTLLLGETMSIIIIVSYMIILCCVTYILYLKKYVFACKSKIS